MRSYLWLYAACFCAVAGGAMGACFHEFTATSGQISFPDPPGTHSNATECRYLVRVPEGLIVVLRFTHLALEPEYRLACRFDSLHVLDGPLLNSTPLGKFCGTELPKPVQSSSNAVSIKLVLDNPYHHAGFRLDYTTKRVQCLYRFTNLSGQIQSPNYPKPYPSSFSCSYLIQVPRHRTIILTFIRLDLKPRHEGICTSDYVEVIDGAQTNSTSRGRFCGNSTALPSVHSAGSDLLVKFMSGKSGHHTGFRISYTSKEEDCTFKFTELSGQFESPNFPESYPSAVDCLYYLIRVPFGFTISLTFLHFDLELQYRGGCRFDFIQLFDGPTSSAPELARFCGSRLPAPVNSTGEALLLKFVTDDSQQRTGFRVRYTTNKVCSVRYTDPTGVLWGYFVHQYPHFPDCHYLIQAPASYTITLHFRYIDLPTPNKECDTHSYIQVFDGSQFSSRSLGRFCGSALPGPLHSTSNSLLVKFIRPTPSNGTDGPYFLAQYSTRYEDPESQCGKVSTLVPSQECLSKILGGKDAARRDVPWQVLIEGRGFICGGSLVRKDWVLTAAHCVQGHKGPLARRSFRVHLGLHRQNRKNNRHVQTRAVARIVAHGNFDYRTLDSDLALVRLSAPAQINSHVNLLCLPSKDRHSRMMKSRGTHGVVSGWGLNARLKETTVLKKVCLPIVRNKTCQEKTSFPIPSATFCAGTGSKDSCRGDSGGAFAVYDQVDQRWFAGGIVSWGTSSACMRRNHGIYVRVDSYVDWIKRVISSA